jgi:hypothetical protein
MLNSIIETNETKDEIVDAINIVAATVSRLAREKNQFAASIMQADVDVAEDTLLETHEQIKAAKLLLRLAIDILDDEENYDK